MKLSILPSLASFIFCGRWLGALHLLPPLPHLPSLCFLLSSALEQQKEPWHRWIFFLWPVVALDFTPLMRCSEIVKWWEWVESFRLQPQKAGSPPPLTTACFYPQSDRNLSTIYESRYPFCLDFWPIQPCGSNVFHQFATCRVKLDSFAFSWISFLQDLRTLPLPLGNYLRWVNKPVLLSTCFEIIEIQKSPSHPLAWKLRIPNIILGVLLFLLGLHSHSSCIRLVDVAWFCPGAREYSHFCF